MAQLWDGIATVWGELSGAVTEWAKKIGLLMMSVACMTHQFLKSVLTTAEAVCDVITSTIQKIWDWLKSNIKGVVSWAATFTRDAITYFV